jgi:hypothetical protein
MDLQSGVRNDLRSGFVGSRAEVGNCALLELDGKLVDGCLQIDEAAYLRVPPPLLHHLSHLPPQLLHNRLKPG